MFETAHERGKKKKKLNIRNYKKILLYYLVICFPNNVNRVVFLNYKVIYSDLTIFF